MQGRAGEDRQDNGSWEKERKKETVRGGTWRGDRKRRCWEEEIEEEDVRTGPGRRKNEMRGIGREV